MPDRLKPGTKQFHDRQRRHRHNGHLGSLKMMQVQLQAMLMSDTTTPTAKARAYDLLRRTGDLEDALRERVDAPTT